MSLLGQGFMPPVSAPFASRYAHQYLVATTDHVASSVATSVLDKGGNAVDAAIACAAALSVVAQHQCGMGGDAFVLVHEPSGVVHALDAAGRAGSGANPDRARSEGLSRLPLRLDVRSATVPGAVAGWVALHERFGSWDFSDLLAPAIELAESGFVASPTLARDVRNVLGIDKHPEFASVRKPGDPIQRPGIARVLRETAAGGLSGFYQGSFAEGLLELGQGEFRTDDLAGANATWVPPLHLEAFGSTLWTMPPVSQGYLILAAAFIADQLDVPTDPSDPLWAHLLMEASRLAGMDRNAVLYEGASGESLLDADQLTERAQRIDPSRRSEVTDHAREGDTNYFAIVDKEGYSVSFVHSNAHGFGSHLVVPATGIFLHNRGIGFSLKPGHPAEYRPGSKPPHTLSPIMATDSRGQLQVVTGTMGADSQPQVLLQLLHRLLVVGEDPATALAAGRWYLGGPDGEHAPFDTWDVPGSANVQLEGQCPPAWTDGLTERGHDVRAAESFGVLAGYAQAIVRTEDALVGSSDPRAWSGSTIGR